MGSMNSFEMLQQYFKLLHNSDKYLLIVKSRGGLGKSYSTIKYLEANKIPFSLINGHITPLNFFQTIKGAGRKIVVLDDVEALLKSKDIMGLIKQATCETINHKRIVQYNSTKILVEDSMFECNAKFILLCNRLPQGVDFKAIISRAFTYNFTPSNMEIMQEIKKCEEFDNDVCKFMDMYCGNHTPIDFRVYENIKEIKKVFPNEWEELAKDNLNISDRDKYMDKLVFSSLTPKQQKEKFVKDTGLGERQFFRNKKKLMGEI